MTHAESVAVEHVAYRRRTGMSWARIASEAKSCLVAMGKPAPIHIDRAWEIERAFATAYCAVLAGRVA